MDIPALLRDVAALPAARRVPAAAPVQEAVIVAGVEVAAVVARDGDAAFRRTWRERHRGGPAPLVLLAPDPERSGSAVVLGPVDAAGVERTIDVDALAQVLRRVSALPRLEAVRELTAELERLDQAGVPGLTVREFLTEHTLDRRLRGDPQRWAALAAAAAAIPQAADWRRTAVALGYTVERLPRYGSLLRSSGGPVAVVHPKRDAGEFARLNADGRPPEGELLNDCLTTGARYGLLASGSRLRLFDATPALGSAAARYLELDTALLRPDDRPFLALLGPTYLAEGGLENLVDDARRFGSALRTRLDATLRQRALPVLGRGLGRWSREDGGDPAEERVRLDLERAALTLVFRVLFLLYAESAGYLPMTNRHYRDASLTALVETAADMGEQPDPRSAVLWSQLTTLIEVMRTGNQRWEVPAYNGALFAADGFEGAVTLERVRLRDDELAPVLLGLGRDAETDRGVDYSSLDIGHLGHIYEGLLSLRLVAAEEPVAYDARADRYQAVDADEADAQVGDLVWQTDAGGRKGGGVYYTREELVTHLVGRAVLPTFEAHLERVEQTVETDPAGAAEQLFDFAVLDPACGSAHFLVVVVNALADRTVRFLAQHPLPAVRATIEHLRAGAAFGTPVDDVALLRRLVLKRCVHGVDVSPMGAEIAKLSLWLASFVPGLSLAYLDRNVVVGNALIGVGRPDEVGIRGPNGQTSALADRLDEALGMAADAAHRVALSEDRTPDEVHESAAADAELRAATAHLERLFDLWTAGPFELPQAREYAELHGAAVLAGEETEFDEQAAARRSEHRFLHWLPAFPRVFRRDRPGFDAVVGNPPWDEVTVERHKFYGRFVPGLMGMDASARERSIARLELDRPDLPARLTSEQERFGQQRSYLRDGSIGAMAGDPDLYKYFCLRYRALLRDGGRLGVVLPRSAFSAKGSAGFRRWLFEELSTERVDFLLNNRLWMFDTHGQWTVALVVAEHHVPGDEHRTAIAGTARSAEEWSRQAAGPGLALLPQAFGPDWAPPLLRRQAEAELLAKLRVGTPFPRGGGRWRCFPVAELHETNDKGLWRGGRGPLQLWKGESFDQYQAHGGAARPIAETAEARSKADKPRPGSGSLLSGELTVPERRAAVQRQLGRARVAFRDVARSTDSRTVIACLVPPRTYLTNKAPYLAFTPDDDCVRLACLAILNSLPFDWQARRFVEVNLNFFILEGLVVPHLDDADVAVLARAAARLSCTDDRYAEVAAALGVEPGPLDEDERTALRLEIDAHVAGLWHLDRDDLDVLLADFTSDAVDHEYRRRLRDRLPARATAA